MGIGEEEEQPLLQSNLPQILEQQHQLLEKSNTDESLIRQTCLELKKIWQIAGPSVFSRLAMFSMTVITQSLAGHLGELDLAAISIVCTVLISISFGFMVKKVPFFFSFINCCQFHPHYILMSD